MLIFATIIGIALGLIAVVGIIRSNSLAILAFFLVEGFHGVYRLFGVPSLAVRSVGDVIILLLFLKAVLLAFQQQKRFRFFGIVPMGLLLVVTVLSAVLNGNSFLSVIVFLRDFLPHYLLFLAIFNLEISEKTNQRFYTWGKWLLLLQVPAGILKLAAYGRFVEGATIGTMAFGSGSLSTVIPLFAMSFLMALYFKTKKWIYVAIVGLFVIFGIINGKRAIIYFIPMVFFAIQLLYLSKEQRHTLVILNRQFVTSFMLVLVLGFASFYAIARLSPSLNPDNAIGGRFDPAFVMEYSENYTTKADGPLRKYRRRDAPGYFLKLFAEAGPSHFLMGNGPGHIVKSRFLNNGDFPILNRYGIDYGGRTGVLWFFIQIGFLGMLFYYLFHIRVALKVYANYRQSTDPAYETLALGMVGIVFVYFVDSFLYSSVMMETGILMAIYHIAAAQLLKRDIKQTQWIKL